MAADASSPYEENFPDGSSSSTYGAFAFPLTAIASQRGQAGKFGNPLVGQRADLRHLRHQPGHRTVGNPLDGAEALIQLMPHSIGVDQTSDRHFQIAYLLLHKVQQLAKGLQHHLVGHQQTLVALRGAQSVSWRNRVTIAFNCCCSAEAGLMATQPLVWAYQAITPASMRSVFSKRPIPWAKFRTARGFTTATWMPAAHSSAKGFFSYPPVASMATKCTLWH